MRQYQRQELFAFCLVCSMVVFCQSSQWKEYVYKEDGFAISSPAKPGLEKVEKKARGFPRIHIYSVHLSGGDLIVACNQLDSKDPSTPEQLLENEKASYPRKVISQRPVALGQYPGVEIEAEGQGAHEKRRTYAVGRRLYVVAAMTDEGKQFPEDFQRWFDSFRLVEAKEK